MKKENNPLVIIVAVILGIILLFSIGLALYSFLGWYFNEAIYWSNKTWGSLGFATACLIGMGIFLSIVGCFDDEKKETKKPEGKLAINSLGPPPGQDEAIAEIKAFNTTYKEKDLENISKPRLIMMVKSMGSDASYLLKILKERK